MVVDPAAGYSDGMGRITNRRRVIRVRVPAPDSCVQDARVDTLAVEEPLEIRVAGAPLSVTMRTPGHDVELAAGFLVSEGVLWRAEQFAGAIHCGGPGTGGVENTFNVLDVSLAPGVRLPSAELARNFYTTSSCGVCGKASIDAVETTSHFGLERDAPLIAAADVLAMPDRLRAEQQVFDKTGGLHAAGLFDAQSGELLVVREDVGRHNAVDKVIGWALLNGRLPLRHTVLQVSGRASFELVQKASMAGIGVLSAVSAPSSLAVDLADACGMTLCGFVRGETMNIYTHDSRIVS